MNQVVEVKRDELVKVLMSVKGPTPATITATTKVRMNKRNNPYLDKVLKTQNSNVFINFNYKNAINKRLQKEGKEANFEPQPRKWGVHVPGTPLVLHKNQYYLEAGYLTKNQPKVSYTMDGEEIEKAVFENYLPAKSPSKSQGLDKEVVMRDFKIENIERVKMLGKEYVVID